MKRALILLLIVAALGIGWYYTFRDQLSSVGGSVSSLTERIQGSGAATSSKEVSPDALNAASKQAQNLGSDSNELRSRDSDGYVDEDDEDNGDERPAGEVYKTAPEALDAIKKGSTDYDDTILQQFVDPGENCTFCAEVYASLRDFLKDSTMTSDQKGYFGEILAMSGQVENIRALVAGIGHAPDEAEKDALAESLELALGGDDMVKYLADFVSSTDTTLKEASIAAISNQGSRLAAEVLYGQAKQSNDPSGLIDQGIGLGEMVPDQEAYSYLQEAVLKRDEYSHLAVKALINAGLPGIKLVVDSIENSTDPVGDKKLLQDALDHVGYDEETKAYMEKLQASSQSSILKDFAGEVIAEFKSIEEEEKDS
jgi:hypothetical protein